MLTVRQRYACIRATGDRRGDAGHDFERDALRPQELYFLAAAAEDERIAALQAHDPPAGLSLFEHDFVDATLPDRMPARLLADADAIGVATRESEHFGRDEAVVQDYVRLLQCAQCVEGQQAGIARPGANQHHGAALRRVRVGQGALEFALGGLDRTRPHESGHRPAYDVLVESPPGRNVRHAHS